MTMIRTAGVVAVGVIIALWWAVMPPRHVPETRGPVASGKQLQCPEGSVLEGKLCVCPKGTSWTGAVCESAALVGK